MCAWLGSFWDDHELCPPSVSFAPFLQLTFYLFGPKTSPLMMLIEVKQTLIAWCRDYSHKIKRFSLYRREYCLNDSRIQLQWRHVPFLFFNWFIDGSGKESFLHVMPQGGHAVNEVLHWVTTWYTWIVVVISVSRLNDSEEQHCNQLQLHYFNF